MRSFSVPVPLPPVPQVQLAEPALPAKILTEDRDAVLADYQARAHSLVRGRPAAEAEAEAYAGWRRMLEAEPAEPIEGAELLPLLSPERLREVWRTTPPERWKLSA